MKNRTIAELKELQAETDRLLAKRLARAEALRKRMAAATKALDGLAAELAGLEGGAGRGGPAGKKAARPGARKRAGTGKPKGKPTQKDLVKQILKDAGKPLSLDDILEELAAREYRWASKEPRKALGVLVYADKVTFRKVGTRRFALGAGKRAAKKK
ncbi:hypothetical protein ACFLSJ_01095 [Verrucomicrobiota bacterium]